MTASDAVSPAPSGERSCTKGSRFPAILSSILLSLTLSRRIRSCASAGSLLTRSKNCRAVRTSTSPSVTAGPVELRLRPWMTPHLAQPLAVSYMTEQDRGAVIAKPKPPPQKSKVKRYQGGSGGGRQPVMRRPAIIKRAPGLAAVKHKQQVAARGALSERYEKASSALASVQAAARAEWPEAMKREMQACRTPEQHRVWSEKWAA